MARLVAPLMSERLGQQVFVDNRGGAGRDDRPRWCEIAARRLHGLAGRLELCLEREPFENLNYDALKDFAAVTLLAKTPSILAVNPALPARA